MKLKNSLFVTKRCFLVFLYVFLSNFICFIMGAFPNNILSLNILNNGILEYQSIINGLLYFIFYILVTMNLLLTLKNENIGSKRYFFKRTFLKTFAPLLLLYLLVDILKVVGSLFISFEYQNIYFIVLHTLYTVFSVFIINKSLNKQIEDNSKLKYNSKCKILLCGLLAFFIVLLASLYIYENIKGFNQMNYYYSKYNILYNNIDVWKITANFSFYLDCINLFYTTFLYTGLVLMFGKAYVEPEKKKEKGKVLRYIVITCLMLVFLSIKAVCFPQGLISSIDISNSNSQTFTEEKDFKSDNESITIKRRGTPIEGYEVNVYQNKIINLKYGNDTVRKFAITLNDEKTPLQKIEIDNIEAYHYTTEALAFLDNEEPKVLLISEINSQEENKILTKVLEELIKEGYFEFLEYSSEYMLKYDEEFIEPYIERYSKGELTEKELEVNAYLEEDYMINFAKSVLSS